MIILERRVQELNFVMGLTYFCFIMINNNDLHVEREGSDEIVKDVDGAHKFKVNFLSNFSK